MVVLNKLHDVPADRIPRVAHRHIVIEARRFQRGWTFNVPLLPPDGAWKYGARPFLRAVAKRDYIVESFAEVRIDYFGPRM